MENKEEGIFLQVIEIYTKNLEEKIYFKKENINQILYQSIKKAFIHFSKMYIIVVSLIYLTKNENTALHYSKKLEKIEKLSVNIINQFENITKINKMFF